MDSAFIVCSKHPRTVRTFVRLPFGSMDLLVGELVCLRLERNVAEFAAELVVFVVDSAVKTQSHFARASFSANVAGVRLHFVLANVRLSSVNKPSTVCAELTVYRGE